MSSLAAAFASPFGAADYAGLAGLWHDLGKYRAGFQRYIRQSADPDAHIEGRVAGPDKTHSAAGALWAQRHLAGLDPRAGPVIARVLTYIIAGHHAGLDDWHDGLVPRLSSTDAQRELADTLAAAIPKAILEPDTALPALGNIRADRNGGPGGRFALWVRMLFSCLVDADFLDTEAFMSKARSEGRPGFASLAEMEARLSAHLTALALQVEARNEKDSMVNSCRASVLRACIARAAESPGVFSLTVPTGGGKTLSSLAFALRHALIHGKRRIVYGIPYTSIIEQTADVFRGIVGDENIVEHHSNVETDARSETARSRLACENWDAPLVVTTNVQLLESLFASRTSRCRKLHNLVDSVVVLDEAQLLPVSFLQPVVDALRILVQDFGVTLVLCTATQPTLGTRSTFDLAHQLRGFGDGEVREIVDDVPGLYAALSRIRVHLPADLRVASTWEAVAADMSRQDEVLAVVGRRADARALYEHLRCTDGAGHWHLSGLMCAQHRSDTIAAIKRALAANRVARSEGRLTTAVRVVSTQLVEAGVDIDFPVVYRALAGLDSIAQAAGRCNREGRLTHGEFHVFVPPKPPPPGLLRMAEQTTQVLWSGMPVGANPLALERFSDYFTRLYANARLDEQGICALLRSDREGGVNFRTAAERFRLIDDKDSATVFVRYKNADGATDIDMLLNTLRVAGPERWLLRKLQRFGVNIYRHDLQRLLQTADIEPIGSDWPGLYVQASDVLYDPLFGVNVDGAPGDPSSLIQ